MTGSQKRREQTSFLIEPPQPSHQVLRDTCRVIQHHTEHQTHCFGDSGDVPTLWSPATCMEAHRPPLPSLTWAPAPAGASSSLPPTKETPTLLTLALSCLQLLWSPPLRRVCCYSCGHHHSVEVAVIPCVFFIPPVQCLRLSHRATCATLQESHIKILFFQEALRFDPQRESCSPRRVSLGSLTCRVVESMLLVLL